VAAYRLDEILAQTDPFDLAQGIERHAATLSESSIRELVAPVIDRAGRYYRDELAFMLNPALSETALRKALVRFLTSNLRAIILFGPAFASDVLKACPQHRVLGIGEERRAAPPAGTRTAVITGTVIALVLLGAAAEHAVTNARAAAQAPEPSVPITVPVVVRSTAAPRASLASVMPVHTQAPRVERPASPPPAPQRTFEGATAEPAEVNAAAAVPIQQAPAPYEPAQPAPRRALPPERPQDAHGTTVTVATRPAAPTPAPTPIDVSDMPNSYEDATPLPQQSAAPAQNASGQVSIATPKPTAKPRRGWLKHLDPFQPGAHIRIP